MGNVLSCLPCLSTGEGSESSTDPDMPGLMPPPQIIPFSVELGCIMSVPEEDFLEQQLNWIQLMEVMQFMEQPENVQFDHTPLHFLEQPMDYMEPQRLDFMEQHQQTDES